MQFNSAEFLIFLPVVLITYFALPYRWRHLFLLAASYYFYMAWKAEYVLLLLLSTTIDYSLALRLERSESKGHRQFLLACSLVSNLGMLFAFKYFNFFNDATRDLLMHVNIFYEVPAFQLLLPVGISFYTFQTLSYTIDVYRGEQKAEQSFLRFALFVSFFPQLVAGPIERASRLLPQFQVRQQVDYYRIASGLRRVAWGFFKKVVIADKAAIIVDAIYQQPQGHSGVTLLLATYLFAFQIYCDFSGYSDIAIGISRMLGIRLMENFRQPYLAQSIGEFWRRWHISLSTWFRDYLYIPLGGNRVGESRYFANLLTVFVVSGLWHGASWTFVIWGFLHGLYMVIEQVWERYGPSLEHLQLPNTLVALGRRFVVFHLVVLAWIFFRANTVGDAFYIVRQIFSSVPWQFSMRELHAGILTLSTLLLSIGLMEIVESLRQANRLQRLMQPRWVRWGSYYVIIIFIMLFGELHAKGQFIYFQF